MIYYFSSTGNSRWVAQKLAMQLGESMLDISNVEKGPLTTLEPSENVGFVFPVYGWDVPKIVKDFILNKLDASSLDGRYVYFVSTCGDDTGKLYQRFQLLLHQVGATIHSGFSVQMPNTYVCLPFFDVDHNALRYQKLQAAPKRLDHILQLIAQKTIGITDTIPGNNAWIKTYVIGWFFRKFLITDKKFWTAHSCRKCKACIQTCPLHNIEWRKDDKPQWKHNCTGCLSCYHHCPDHAIRWGQQTNHKGQYLFQKHADEMG